MNDLINLDKEKSWKDIFQSLGPANGKLAGIPVRKEMEKSKLPNDILRSIWIMADQDRDGSIGYNEFVTIKQLINLKLVGFELPSVLDSSRLQYLMNLEKDTQPVWTLLLFKSL